MKRWFITGGEWLYYKIYSGYDTADRILADIIGPLSHMFIENKSIDNWFFIRYADPHPHIRWRLHFSDLSKIGDVTGTIENALIPLVDTKQINRVQTDTYKREIERYGMKTMEYCEQMFGYDSQMISNMLTVISGYENAEQYRWMFSIMAIDTLLSDFGYSLDDRHSLLKSLADNFGKEFNINEFTIKQFSRKYRDNKDSIQLFMKKDDSYDSNLYQMIYDKSHKSRNTIMRILELTENRQDLDSLMGSLIHMTMNRIFVAQQRKHEVVVYGFMERFYRSEVAKNKYVKNK